MVLLGLGCTTAVPPAPALQHCSCSFSNTALSVFSPMVRYHLYISYACPWASRCYAILMLKGLEDVIGLTVRRLCCTVLYCTVLYCTVLYCIVLPYCTFVLCRPRLYIVTAFFFLSVDHMGWAYASSQEGGFRPNFLFFFWASDCEAQVGEDEPRQGRPHGVGLCHLPRGGTRLRPRPLNGAKFVLGPRRDGRPQRQEVLRARECCTELYCMSLYYVCSESVSTVVYCKSAANGVPMRRRLL